MPNSRSSESFDETAETRAAHGAELAPMRHRRMRRFALRPKPEDG
jgi:hypothetical protein